MTDLVQRLRRGYTGFATPVNDACNEAAHRIEYLERENAELRVKLKDCRNATLEEAAEKCEALAEGRVYAAEEYGMHVCRNEIRSLKHDKPN